MPALGLFELEFEKTIIIFEISALERIKMSLFGTKDALFRYFLL